LGGLFLIKQGKQIKMGENKTLLFKNKNKNGMHTCKLFHITYNAIVLSGKNPKVKPASKPDGIACNFESLLKIRRSRQDIS
jgi:hypothetical protein